MNVVEWAPIVRFIETLAASDSRRLDAIYVLIGRSWRHQIYFKLMMISSVSWRHITVASHCEARIVRLCCIPTGLPLYLELVSMEFRKSLLASGRSVLLILFSQDTGQQGVTRSKRDGISYLITAIISIRTRLTCIEPTSSYVEDKQMKRQPPTSGYMPQQPRCHPWPISTRGMKPPRNQTRVNMGWSLSWQATVLHW